MLDIETEADERRGKRILLSMVIIVVVMFLLCVSEIIYRIGVRNG